MSDSDHKAKAKKLTRLWIILFIVLSMLAKVYVSSFGVTGFTAKNVPIEYFLAVIVIVVFGSCPLLLRIGYHAKIANMRFRLWFSRIMVIQHVFTVVVLLFENIKVSLFA